MLSSAYGGSAVGCVPAREDLDAAVAVARHPDVALCVGHGALHAIEGACVAVGARDRCPRGVEHRDAAARCRAVRGGHRRGRAPAEVAGPESSVGREPDAESLAHDPAAGHRRRGGATRAVSGTAVGTEHDDAVSRIGGALDDVVGDPRVSAEVEGEVARTAEGAYLLAVDGGSGRVELHGQGEGVQARPLAARRRAEPIGQVGAERVRAMAQRIHALQVSLRVAGDGLCCGPGRPRRACGRGEVAALAVGSICAHACGQEVGQ